ncbi:MAG: hypothetical protein KDA53_13760 [Hyphomonas sp.]|nr:hypothetical protein [Hyphomonas sp.]
MIRPALAALALSAAADPALAQASDDTSLAIQLQAGGTRTIFVSGTGGVVPIFSLCLDRVNGKKVYVHIADSIANIANGTKQVLPEGGCLFASGRIVFLSADETSTEPGFENASALVNVSIVRN